MELKRGDVVRLKSGGPLMTIEDIAKYDYSVEDKALCAWFNKTEKCTDTFPLDALKIAE